MKELKERVKKAFIAMQLKEKVKKAFLAMHDDELYDAWDKYAQVMHYADSVTVHFMHDLDGFFKDWGTCRLFMLFEDSPDFKITDEYYSYYKRHLVSAGNLTIDFLPIADNLSDAIDYVVEHHDDLGNARLEEVLDGTANEGTFMSFEEDFLRVMRTLTTEELIKVYNECMSQSPEDMIYPMEEFPYLWDNDAQIDEAKRRSGDRFSFNDDWYYAVVSDADVFESFTDLTIDDEPINKNLEYILQEVAENNNDFGIQKIKNLIIVHETYDDFG